MTKKRRRDSNTQRKTSYVSVEQKSEEKTALWTTILGVLGVIIAAVSAIAMIKSNRLAEDANKISEQNLEPKLTTSLAFSIPELGIEMMNINGDWNLSPCRMKSDDSLYWQTHYLIGIDVSNAGVNSFSITGIVIKDQNFSNYEPFSNFITITTSDIRFTSYEEYKKWKENTSYSFDDLTPFGNVSWENTPILMENGSTKRLMIGVTLSAMWNKTLTKDIVSKLIPDLINIPIDFSLGNNTVKSYAFKVDNLFLDIFDGTEDKSITDFSFCQ